MAELAEIRKVLSSYLTRPVVKILTALPVSPDFLSWLGFVIVVGAAALIATEHLFAAGFAVLLAGFFDLLDGALARQTDRSTRSGALLDSTLDRLSESLLLLSLLFIYARDGATLEIVLVGVVLVLSLMVSYLRARGEALGVDCRVGIFTRAERVIVLALGLLLNHFNHTLNIALIVIASLSFITIIQRVVYIRGHLKENPPGV